MKLRSLFLCIALLGWLAWLPSPVASLQQSGVILKVDAQAPHALETLHDLGLRAYGQTHQFFLVENSPGAQSSLASKGLLAILLSLNPNLPIYLVYLPDAQAKAEIASFASVLWDEDKLVVIQMDERAALKAAQLRCELVRLPDVPHPVYLPSIRTYPIPVVPDTFIQRLVNKVSQDSIRAKIQRLQNFRTRYSYTDSCRAAEQYVFDYFSALGLDSVAFDPYQYQGYTWRNVIGTCVGRTNPRKIVIICGHMDATAHGDPDTLAPGAEDDASGTVMALEAARILARENLDLTVKFIAFTGEEEGVIGSQHYAQLMRNQNADVLGVLNFDMVAWSGAGFEANLDCESEPLAQFEKRMALMYAAFPAVNFMTSYGDFGRFREQGYSATDATDNGGHGGPIRYPYYHSSGDTLGNLSMPLASEMAKMGVATLATLGVAPLPPDDFVLRDAGAGGSLDAAWLPNVEPDLAGYKLFWGTVSQTYNDSVTLSRQTSYRIAGLQNGTRYFSAVVAIDSAGHESGLSPEESAVPGVVPASPSGLAALPFYFGMRLTWLRNTERDLAGYNLYRSTMPGGNYLKLNSGVISDTAYRDSSLLSDTMYYYVVTAVDTSRNESPYSSEVRGKPITLDQGILLVDETRDGTGQRGSPSDAQVDAFYHAMLQGTHYTDWDATQQGIPLAGDVGPYSTVVWHADDYQAQMIYNALPGLANYLSYGGKFWLVGWKPIYGLMNRLGTYPYTFIPGQFPYDYLHLNYSAESQLTDFLGASGQMGYSNVSVDTMKDVASWAGKLPRIDTAIPRDAETVFTFNSATGDTAFQGKSVGVRWLTGPYRIVFFGFPFYFMKDSEARQVAVKVLQDLGEPVGVEAGAPSLPLSTALFPVYPNPSRGSARIEYALAEKGRVRLSVYNVSGQLVRELVEVVQPPGRYSASWDGRDQRAHPLPSGVYFCHFNVGCFSDTKKIVMVR